MKYIDSFLRKIKDVRGYAGNWIKKSKKKCRYFVACLAGAGILMVSPKVAGHFFDKLEEKTQEEIQETIIPIQSEEPNMFSICFISGLLIGNFEIEQEEELVLFGKSETSNINSWKQIQFQTQTLSISLGEFIEHSKKDSIQNTSIQRTEVDNLESVSLALEGGTGKTISQEEIKKSSLQEAAKKNAEKASIKETTVKNSTEKVSSEKKTSSKKTTVKSTQKTSSQKTQTKTTVSQTNERTDLKEGLELVWNEKMQMTLTEEEIEIMERIVEAEATDEDIYGRILVANVVLNRVLNDNFPSTVKKVVFQKGQFSPIRDGRYYSVKVTSLTEQAVERALTGEDYSDGALFFFARKLTTAKKASWFDNSLKRLFRYGAHEFFKNK